MPDYRVAIVGTGVEDGGGDEGFAMGYRHAAAFASHPACEIVACADVVPEHANRFADAYGLPSAAAHTDHVKLVKTHEPDIVSVATPIPTHAAIVADCVDAGPPVAIHCEKPMSNRWNEVVAMVDGCAAANVQLTINHQLRLSEPVRLARELIENGRIGAVRRVEGARGDLYEAGIHQLDLCTYFAGDVSASWVMGSIDFRDGGRRSGMLIEDQATGLWEFTNGIFGLMATGDGQDAIGSINRVIGDAGEIAIDFWHEDPLRLRQDGEGWQSIECSYGVPIETAIEDIVSALENGREPVISGANAKRGAEIAFGIYESVRQRARIDLPLTIEDDPLAALVERGRLGS